MLPLPAAFMALKAADVVIGGLKSLRPKQPQVPQNYVPQPQARARPNVSNAPRFAEIFGQQTSILKADGMARTIADRLVQISHRPMRTEQMQSFIQVARQAYVSLAKGESAQSPAVTQFAQLLRGKLDMTQPQVDQVLGQLTDLAKADDGTQNAFLVTGGNALSLAA